MQASFEDHTRDTEIDAPMAHLNLHNLQVGFAAEATGQLSFELDSARHSKHVSR